MIIIKKKRIIFMILAVLISVISFSLRNKEKNTVSVSSLPITNKVIILDAGHGLPDEGN